MSVGSIHIMKNELFEVEITVRCPHCDGGWTNESSPRGSCKVCDICEDGLLDVKKTGSAWTQLSSITKYKNKFFSVREDEIIRPDGKVGKYFVHEKPPSVFIVPISNDGEIYMIKQHRYATGTVSWEVPAGAIDWKPIDWTSMPPKESTMEEPLEAAKRELWEETGLKAEVWEPAGRLLVAPGLSAHYGEIFIARQLTQTGHDERAEEGIMDVAKFPLYMIREMITLDKINDGPTISVLAKAFWAA